MNEQYLEGLNLYLHPSKGMWASRKSFLTQIVERRGGSISTDATEEVSHMICDEALLSGEVAKALGQCGKKCVAVKVEWLCHCEKRTMLLPTQGYGLSVARDDHAGETSGTSKRQRSDDGLDGGSAGGQPAKKAATGMASIFLNPPPSTWVHSEAKGTMTWFPEEFKYSRRVAAFDLDSTLIKTKSGGTFPKDEYDWEFINKNELKAKLQGLVEGGYSLIIISNQVATPHHPAHVCVPSQATFCALWS